MSTRQSRENRKINYSFQQTELIHRNVFTNAVKHSNAQCVDMEDRPVKHTGARCVRKKKILYKLYSIFFFSAAPSPCGKT
jgi:hypothetical protein